MKTPARRMQHLHLHYFASLVSRIASFQSEGREIIRLDEGNPDLPPAPFIVDALQRASSSPDLHGYQPHRGTASLRFAWAEMYRRLYEVEIDPDRQILPLLGSKEGIFHLHLALIEPGDIVLIPDPGYITYTRGTLFSGGDPYYMPLLASRGYLPDLTAIPVEIAKRAKMIWLNYPNNPTSATAPLDFFYKAVEFARQYDILICHDAAYAQVCFDETIAPSILQIPGAVDVAVEFNTLSKSHNMAGWRAGAALGQLTALHGLYNLKTNADSGHFAPILEASTQAMLGDQSWISQRNRIYQERRDLAIKYLHGMGLNAIVPRASLYIWSPVPEGWKSSDFALSALEHAGVSLTPGNIFGDHGEGYVRISLTSPIDRIEQAMQQLSTWLQNGGRI